MVNLDELITDEAFEKAEQRRLEDTRHHFRHAYSCLTRNDPEAIETMRQRITSLDKDTREELTESDSTGYAARITCLKIYYRKTNPQRLPEFMDQTVPFLRTRKKNFGRTAVLYYRYRKIPKKEFLEEMQKDLDFIERYEVSQTKIKENPRIRLAAARRVGGIAQFLGKYFQNQELFNKVVGKYKDLYQYWIDSP